MTLRDFLYHEEDGIELYCGDCREVLPLLASDSAGVVIADVPYNVGKDYGAHDDRMATQAYETWLREVLTASARVSRDAVLYFPGIVNVFGVAAVLGVTPLRPVRQLAWRRREFAGDSWGTGPAICWEPVVWASKADKAEWNRGVYGHMGRDFLDVPTVRFEPFRDEHPCVKPLLVMQWLIGLFAPEDLPVVDPCCGSGTTLEAARLLGRRAIGIEIEEKYCRIAKRRLAQGVLSYYRDGVS